MQISWQIQKPSELSTTQLYDILSLRNQVFIVEQNCPYQDIDGLDLLAGTLHVTARAEGTLIACARILHHDAGTEPVKIGRVIVDSACRGQKLGQQLMGKTMHHLQDIKKAIHLSAQSHLTGFYRSFGFEPVSAEYLEDNIPHTNMAFRPGRYPA